VDVHWGLVGLFASLVLAVGCLSSNDLERSDSSGSSDGLETGEHVLQVSLANLSTGREFVAYRLQAPGSATIETVTQGEWTLQADSKPAPPMLARCRWSTIGLGPPWR